MAGARGQCGREIGGLWTLGLSIAGSRLSGHFRLSNGWCRDWSLYCLIRFPALEFAILHPVTGQSVEKGAVAHNGDALAVMGAKPIPKRGDAVLKNVKRLG